MEICERSSGEERTDVILAAVFAGKSNSWHTICRSGFVDIRRKKRVSEPAPREIICFFRVGWEERKRLTRESITVVRTYVPEIPSLSTRWYHKKLERGIGSSAVPLFIMGSLLCISPVTKAFANGSLRYPASTALSLETLAS